MKTIKIRWMGKRSKTVELPVPFVSKCEKTGEVLCDPIGEFPYEDGMKLLEITGDSGLFQLAEEADSEPEDIPVEAEASEPRYVPSKTYQKHRRKRRWYKKPAIPKTEAKSEEPSPLSAEG